MTRQAITAGKTLAALVIGKDGLIGAALCAHLLSQGTPVWATSRRSDRKVPETLYLDLAHPVSDFPMPQALTNAFFCAGATGLKYCEEHTEESRTVNVTHTLELASRLVEAGVFTVYLSTSRTKADDAYTEQKLEAERGFLSFGENAAVVKLSKVFAPDTPLIQGWMNSLKRGNVIEPFSDMEVAPLSADFVAGALATVAVGRHSGVINLGPMKSVSYAELARHLATRLGGKFDLVRPVTAARRGIEIDLAMNDDLRRMETELGIPAPDPYDEFDRTFGLLREEKS